MLRVIGSLVLALVGSGAILFADFNRMVSAASATDAEPPSFQAFLETVPKKLASLTAPTQTKAPVLSLDTMLPRAPEGWTMRPVADGDADIADFLPRSGDDAGAASINLVKAAASTSVPEGATVAIQAYERGERRVIFQLVRLPDSIFTGLEAIDRRHELQVQAAEMRGRPFMTVRGLDVTEEFLGDGMRLRYFTASVGAQLQIRVMASRRLKDGQLVPFFETLNVRAMNEAVVDRQPGLGEVPVMVLGSALGEEDGAAYQADRAERAASAIRRADELRDLARAELTETAQDVGASPTKNPQHGLPTTECRTGPGVKRCSVSSGG